MSETTEAPPVALARTHLNPAHAEAFIRFGEILEHLREHGWVNLRVDTLVHPSDDGQRDRHSIRHQYCAGEWTLTFERDRTFNRPDRANDRRVRLVSGRSLPTVAAAVSELFGPNLRHYFPLETQETPAT